MGRAMVLVLEIGTQIRKATIVSIRSCYRSVYNHPFLIGMLCSLILLYKSSPFTFSILVSASPVLVCTAVLLGTLLSFGQPNLPEIKRDERVSLAQEQSSTGILANATVISERDESFEVERFSESSRDIEKRSSVEEGKFRKGMVDYGLEGYAPLIDKKLEEREDNGLELEKKREINARGLRFKVGLGDMGEPIESGYSLIQNVGDEVHEVEDRILQEPLNSQKGYHLDLPLDDDDDEIKSYDSGSDRAESSSPDASMADIIPMLDELHPLLDSEAPDPTRILCNGSDTVSDHFRKSDDYGSVPFDDDTNIREEYGADENAGGDDDDVEEEEEEEEEEEVQGSKDDESKSAIKWTEDDQKNLMDLGTLELERNQRLENLIARRRARNSFRMMAEKNLIDFDSVDLPFNVPPISTARKNPFDGPFDSYDTMPIPGSAPSSLLPRRNPFDLPYDSNEEKPDLKGDNFEQEFMPSNLNSNTFFRRYESFNPGPSGLAFFHQERHDIGPSGLGRNRQERQDLKWRPYFVPERLASEGTSYSSSRQRQSSDASDSKLSSIHDSESVSSAADLEEENKLDEQELDKEIELVSNQAHASVVNEHAEERDAHHDVVEITLGDIGNCQDEKKLDEQQLVQETTFVSNKVGDFEAIESGLDTEKVEKIEGNNEVVEITLDGTEIPKEMELTLSETGGADTNVEVSAGEIHSEREEVAGNSYSRNSSSSSFLEISEKAPDGKGVVVKPATLEQRDLNMEKSGMSRGPSLGVVNYYLNMEPVYDSNPSPEEKLIPLPTISSEKETEISIGKTKSVVPVHVIEKDSTSMEQTFHNENDHSNSSISRAEILVGVHHDENNKLNASTASSQISSRSLISSASEERPSSLLELVSFEPKISSLVGKAMEVHKSNNKLTSKHAFGNHDEPQEPAIALKGSAKEFFSAIAKEVCEVFATSIPSIASDSAPPHSENSEYISPTSGAELKGDLNVVSEQLDFLAESYQFGDEVSDEGKEINEGFLSELDTVGDFSVPEKIDMGKTKLEPLRNEESNLTETYLHLPVLEARSLEDINLAFCQLYEGVEVKEVILPGKVEILVKEEPVGTLDSDSDLQVLEAKSLESTNFPLQQVSEEKLEISDLKDSSVDAGATKVDLIQETETRNVIATDKSILKSDGERSMTSLPIVPDQVQCSTSTPSSTDPKMTIQENKKEDEDGSEPKQAIEVGPPKEIASSTIIDANNPEQNFDEISNTKLGVSDAKSGVASLEDLDLVQAPVSSSSSSDMEMGIRDNEEEQEKEV